MFWCPNPVGLAAVLSSPELQISITLLLTFSFCVLLPWTAHQTLIAFDCTPCNTMARTAPPFLAPWSSGLLKYSLCSPSQILNLDNIINSCLSTPIHALILLHYGHRRKNRVVRHKRLLGRQKPAHWWQRGVFLSYWLWSLQRWPQSLQRW